MRITPFDGRVLNVLEDRNKSQPERFMVRQIAGQVGLHRSNIHARLVDLEGRGVVVRSGRRWALGLTPVQIQLLTNFSQKRVAAVRSTYFYAMFPDIPERTVRYSLLTLQRSDVLRRVTPRGILGWTEDDADRAIMQFLLHKKPAEVFPAWPADLAAILRVTDRAVRRRLSLLESRYLVCRPNGPRGGWLLSRLRPIQ